MLRRCLLSAAVVSMLLVAIPPASAHGLGWVRQFGSADIDWAYSVAYTGNAVYAVGETRGHLPGKTSNGDFDAFLVKFDTAGTLMWTRQFGTDAADSAYGVAADATGIYVAGETLGPVPGGTKRRTGEAYLRKFTPSGATAWTVQFGTNKEDAATRVAVGPDGITVAGATLGTFGNQHRHGEWDAFVAQFDTLGHRHWLRQFGSQGTDVAYGVATDVNGAVVSGFAAGRLPGQTYKSGRDAFVVAFAPDGSRRWTHEFGTSNLDQARAVAVHGGITYVVGDTGGTLPGQQLRGFGDAFVRAYAVDGAGLWTHQFGTLDYDAGTGVAVDATGLYVLGSTWGVFKHQTDRGRVDAFVRAFDLNGTGRWTHQFGSNGTEEPSDCVTDGGGTVYAIGSTSGRMRGETNLGYDDAFVAQIS
jgi:hypothetical protein